MLWRFFYACVLFLSHIADHRSLKHIVARLEVADYVVARRVGHDCYVGAEYPDEAARYVFAVFIVNDMSSDVCVRDFCGDSMHRD